MGLAGLSLPPAFSHSLGFQPTAAREIVAFVRLFTRGGVALQEPCLNRDTRAEWPA
jgi:hypothetical protein